MTKNKLYIIGIIILIILALGLYSFGTQKPIPNNTNTANTEASSTQNSTSKTQVNTSKTFSVIVLPDTQFYSQSHPDIFCDQTDWIVKNKDKLNIVFTVQLGDIVNDGGSIKKEWQTAVSCLGKLDGKVPYSVLPGNHDIETPHKKETGFATYTKNFPPSKFSKYSWYKGNFEDNVNNYEIIDTNGIKLMFLNLGIEPSDSALAWADKVVKENPNIYTIFATHKYLSDVALSPENTRSYSKDGNTGKNIWDKLISKDCSIKLTLSGHFHTVSGENRIMTKNACDDDVNQILQDYQGRENGGDGLLRIYTFSPAEKIIYVSTYSPYTNTFEKDANSEFTLPFVD